MALEIKDVSLKDKTVNANDPIRIECWAENETLVRLILIPIQVTLLGPPILARLLSVNGLEDSR